MECWLANGVQLGWLIDPLERRVHVYEPGIPSRLKSGDAVIGNGPIDGFSLDLTEAGRCYE